MYPTHVIIFYSSVLLAFVVVVVFFHKKLGNTMSLRMWTWGQGVGMPHQTPRALTPPPEKNSTH